MHDQPQMSSAQLDLIENLLSRQGKSKTLAAKAARDVLVHGLSRPAAQARHGITRATLAKAISLRLSVLNIALHIALLHQHHTKG